MEAEQIYEVVEKLIGPVHPVADAAIDSDRYENMEKFIEVFVEMYRTIDNVSYEHADSPYGSAKSIGQRAKNCLYNL